jgi:hypothetical protein
LNGSIKPPGGENGRDGEASSFLAEGEAKPEAMEIPHNKPTNLIRYLIGLSLWHMTESDHLLLYI